MSSKLAAARREHKMVLFACAALLGLSGAGGAAAQASGSGPQATTEVDTVIVTARRKEENLQSVPLAVSALSQRQLQAQGIVTLVDVQRVAPGLTVTPTSSGSARPAYQIRGQRAASTGIAFDQAVAVYFAEVAAGRAAGTPQSLYDLSSIQVLKGPQGTLFGRNTTGGAILITPNGPSREFEGHVKAATGNYSLGDLEGVLNIPLGDRLQVRLAGKYYRRDGYFHNVINDQYTWDEDSTSLRLSVRVQPTDYITSDFIGTSFYSNVSGFQAKLFDVNPTTAPAAFLAALQAENALGASLGYYAYRDPFQPRNKDDVKGIQNITTIDLGDNLGLLGNARIKNISGYRKLKNSFANYADGTNVGVIDGVGGYRGDQFSDELQLQGESGKIDYVAGLYYFTESGLESQNLQNFRNLPRSFNEYEARNRSKSAFVHINYDLSALAQGLSFSAGGRITKDTRFINAHHRQARNPAIGPAFFCTVPGIAGPLAVTSLSDRGTCSLVTRAAFTEPTWDASLNWQVDPDHLVYLAHRHGYRSGAAPILIAPELKPEKVNDVEVGSKNTFDLNGRSVRLNVAAYYGKYSNLQRSSAALINGVALSANLNAAKSNVYGLETDLRLPLSDRFRLDASYALTIAKYDEFNNLVRGVLVDDSSSRFAFTPKHAFNVAATYDLPLDPGLGQATLSLNYAYQSSQQTTESNSKNPLDPWSLNTTGVIKGYGLLGFRADWRRPMGAKADLAFFVTNLADKKYRAGAFALTNVLGIASYWPGAPRMYGVELTVPFGAEAK